VPALVLVAWELDPEGESVPQPTAAMSAMNEPSKIWPDESRYRPIIVVSS
jgi:hypothetical protein